MSNFKNNLSKILFLKTVSELADILYPDDPRRRSNILNDLSLNTLFNEMTEQGWINREGFPTQLFVDKIADYQNLGGVRLILKKHIPKENKKEEEK